MTPEIAEEKRRAAAIVRRMEQLREDLDDGEIDDREFRREYAPLERELDAIIRERDRRALAALRKEGK